MPQPRCIEIIRGKLTDTLLSEADLLVDAIFGTGYNGALSDELQNIADLVNSSGKPVVSVDIPLGIDGDSAELVGTPVRADITVALTLSKPAHLSYPAREYMGRITVCDLGLYKDVISDNFRFSYFGTDEVFVKQNIPRRQRTANKGSFGKTLHITGSDKYKGAAHLALEASLRSGVGIVGYLGAVSCELRGKFPEAIYERVDEECDTASQILDISGKYSSVLVGSGSGVSEELYRTVMTLLEHEGGTLILDADAINSISAYGDISDLSRAKRQLILTPHPLELSRLSGLEVGYINSHRIRCTQQIAEKYRITLLLKGAGTVISNGSITYINTTGSTALSKGGSGDVLSGLIASLAAQGTDPTVAAALGAYLHGRAADALSDILSELGVTPSDLPVEIARQINLILSQK